MTPSCRTGILAAGVLLTCTASAFAQAGWTDPADVLSPRGSEATRIAMDAGGNAVAIWTDHRAGNPFGDAFVGHFTRATERWTDALITAGRSLAWDLAVDGLGNAVAIVIQRALVADLYQVYRYDHQTTTWTRDDLLPSSAMAGARVAMNAAGVATVCWDHPNGSIHCSRYTPSTNTWSTGVQVGFSTALGNVAMDAAGVAHVVWTVGSNVRTARFEPGAGVWSAPEDLAVGLAADVVPDPHLAMNAAGDAVATWSRGLQVEASRYAPGVGWAPAAVLSVDGTANGSARAAVDPSGVGTVAWVHEAPAIRTVQAARFVGGTWTMPVDVSGPGAAASGRPALAADATGTVHVLWRHLLATRTHLMAARFASGASQWQAPADLSGPADAIGEPGIAVDGTGLAVAVWSQDLVVRSRRWDPTPAPPVITAVSTSSGALSVSFVLPPSAEPVLGLDHSVDGGTTWTPATSLASPLPIAGLTDGVSYDVRLRAANGAGTGRSTDQLLVTPGAAIAPPHLGVVDRAGASLTFAWTAPTAGVMPSTYLLEGGLVPGQTLGTVTVAGDQTNTAVALPTGVFYVRVTGVSRLGRGPTSNEIRVAVGTPDPPAAPSNLLGAVAGADLQLSWTNALDGGTPTRLTLHVSGASTGALVLPVSETLAVSGVPAGTYTVALSASNDAGTSLPSAPLILTFPATCPGPPAPPLHLSASVTSGIVTLAWDPPAAGPAIAGYVVTFTGTFAGAVATPARVVAAPAPAGSYSVRVAARNACGVGAATPPIVVVVP